MQENPPFLTDEPVRTGPLLFLRSIRRVMSRTPLWLVPAIAIALLALPVGFSWHKWFSGTVAHRYLPDAVAPAGGEEAPAAEAPFLWDDQVVSLTASFRHDHAGGLSALNAQTAAMGAPLALIAILVGILAAGGWLQVILERTHGRANRRFWMGAGRYLFRFVRVFVLVLVVLAGWRWLLYGPLWDEWVLERWFQLPAGDGNHLEALDSELHARALEWGRDGLHALGFMIVLAWGTYTRTRLARFDGRSALKAGFLTVFTLLRYPIKTLRPLILLGFVELVLVTFALGSLSRFLATGLPERPSVGLVLVMALLSFIALAVREMLRGARYHAAVKVSQEITQPPEAQPDPWQAIGGPGGPQYPVGEQEETEYVMM